MLVADRSILQFNMNIKVSRSSLDHPFYRVEDAFLKSADLASAAWPFYCFFCSLCMLLGTCFFAVGLRHVFWKKIMPKARHRIALCLWPDGRSTVLHESSIAQSGRESSILYGRSTVRLHAQGCAGPSLGHNFPEIDMAEPLRKKRREDHPSDLPTSLVDLPPEMIERIFSFCDADSLTALSHTNHVFRRYYVPHAR